MDRTHWPFRPCWAGNTADTCNLDRTFGTVSTADLFIPWSTALTSKVTQRHTGRPRTTSLVAPVLTSAAAACRKTGNWLACCALLAGESRLGRSINPMSSSPWSVLSVLAVLDGLSVSTVLRVLDVKNVRDVLCASHINSVQNVLYV